MTEERAPMDDERADSVGTVGAWRAYNRDRRAGNFE